MTALPYITATGNIEKALRAIQVAATPPKVSQDFVKTILKIQGGSGDQVTSFLKKIGFAAADGTPTEIYSRFRNPSTAGQAAADAIRQGYAPLFKRNEFMYELSDADLKGLIIQETGQSNDSNTVSMIFSCLKALKKFATWTVNNTVPVSAVSPMEHPQQQSFAETSVSGANELGLNLAYTINLNLPATSDIAVFNAIFKSLKEHLLKND
jgi:hypothetical protein